MKEEFCNNDVINEVSEKMDVPKFLLKKIESHWHSYVQRVISSGNFENVRIPYLVTFEFNKKKMDAINYSKAKNVNKQQ
jgi:hypothetical protein